MEGALPSSNSAAIHPRFGRTDHHSLVAYPSIRIRRYFNESRDGNARWSRLTPDLFRVRSIVYAEVDRWH